MSAALSDRFKPCREIWSSMGMTTQLLPENQALLTSAEVAELLRVAPDTVWRYGKTGVLSVVHLTPRTLRYTAESVRRLIDGDGQVAHEGSR